MAERRSSRATTVASTKATYSASKHLCDDRERSLRDARSSSREGKRLTKTEPQASAGVPSAIIHLCVYAPGTFYCNPLKPFVNMFFGSSYAIAYAHFRRDHSKPINLWAHVGCLFLQVIGNFALLDCVDSILGFDRSVVGRNASSFTALSWAMCLILTPSPRAVRFCTVAVIAGALLTRSFFTEVVGFSFLSLLTGPGDVWSFWLYLPDHGLPRPGRLGCLALLSARSALWVALRGYEGALGGLLGLRTSSALMVGLLASGSLVRSRNNLPLVSQFGSIGWLLSLSLGQPWVYFLSLSFLGAGLQGVAHELTKQLGTLNQLKDASYELAHTTFFPVLTLQSLHHGWFGPHEPTVKQLGAHGDRRSREALGISD